jgi:hypothetical protein
MTYEEVYADWKYLWDIAPANDMTGGYVDQDDLLRMLKSPSKATAKYCLERQMEYWFQAGPDGFEVCRNYDTLCEEFPRVEQIRAKYDFTLRYW